MLPEICAGLVILGVTAYAVFGSADFGAGFWDLTAGGAERGGRVRGMIQRSMSPVWEANHVWLIFVLVMVWTAFPVAFGSLMSTLSIPLFLAALGVIFRGMAFALRGQAATINEARVLGAVFAFSSVLIPFFFGAAIGGIASGRVPVGNAAGDMIDSWLNPTSVAIGIIAILTGAHLAAVFLTGDAQRAELPDMIRAFRVRAVGSGIAAGVVALCSLLIVKSDAPELYEGLTSGDGLLAVLVSGAAGFATIAPRRHGPLRPRPLRRRARRRRDDRRVGARPGPVRAARSAHGRTSGRERHNPDRLGGQRRPRHARIGPIAVVAVPTRPAGHARPGVRAARPALQAGGLMKLMFACLILGLPLMLLFDHPLTRIAGVVLCLGFIVSGVFLIANPEDLGRDEA